MAKLTLGLRGLQIKNPVSVDEQTYTLKEINDRAWDWDKVVKGSHTTNCSYSMACNMHLYVKDGVVIREEQVGNYPIPNNANVPDYNPKGCQKGVCYADRMYDAARLKYPLKRVGARGEGKWQRVSWDQALTEIADTMIDVLVKEGNDTILRAGSSSFNKNSLALEALIATLGIPIPSGGPEIGDEHPGAALSTGKSLFGGSADNWYHADIILVWGTGGPYTHLANWHFITEARYNGSKVVSINPDFNSSAPFADLWVPVNIGTDAAFALSMAQVVVEGKLYKEDFLREQTDLPLLVREDTKKFLTEKDMRRGGKEDQFYFFDTKSQKVVEASRLTLKLDGLAPALEGEYEVRTQSGRVKVKPVFEYLKQKLQDYTPEKAEAITGVAPEVSRQLARDIAAAKGVVAISTFLWGKFYHGGLIQRAQMLLFALCGQFGRPGAGYDAWSMFYPDSALAGYARTGRDDLLTASAVDPRFSQWRADGYTDEMIVYQYMNDAQAKGLLYNTALLYYYHAGQQEIHEKYNSWDPYLKRPVDAYVAEAIKKGWQVMVPKVGKEPRIIIEGGGSFLRRDRRTDYLMNVLLPKLKMLVTMDFRMGTTALHSDYVLPVASSYERYEVVSICMEHPVLHVFNKAVEPIGEAKNEWEIACLLAKRIEERAKERGILTFTDVSNQQRRLDTLYSKVTAGGMYSEEDEEAACRDYYMNATNVEKMDWEEYKEKGFAAYTGVGKSAYLGFATDVNPGDPVFPLGWHVLNKMIYPTQTRRMQFYIDHDWFLEFGEELPTHKDNPPIGGNYPLKLTGGHARWSVHSSWADHALILRLQRGEPLMFMNINDAKARGLNDNDEVEVHNDFGQFRVHISASPAVKPGQCIIYHSWENFQFKGRKHFKSVLASPINPIDLVGGFYHIKARAIYSGQPGGCDRGTRVEVRKA